MNKQVLAFTLFVRNSSRHVYDDCSMKKQPISAAVVLKFSELLNELKNHIETLISELSEYVSIFVIVIGSFFIFRFECFVIPTSLRQVLTLIKFVFNCSLYLPTFSEIKA